MTADGFCATCGGPIAWYATQGWRHVRGSRAVVRKHPVEQLGHGDPPVSLSEREGSLVQAWATGSTVKEWADSVGISYHTAKIHAQRARAKLGGRPRAEVVAICMRAGVVT